MSAIFLPEPGDKVVVQGKGPGILEAIGGQLATVVMESGNKEIVSLSKLTSPGPSQQVDDDAYLEFQCDPDPEIEGCGAMVTVQLESPLKPGQAAVVECGNCGLSWSVYNPPLETIRTDRFEEIWPIIGQ